MIKTLTFTGIASILAVSLTAMSGPEAGEEASVEKTSLRPMFSAPAKKADPKPVIATVEKSVVPGLRIQPDWNSPDVLGMLRPQLARECPGTVEAVGVAIGIDPAINPDRPIDREEVFIRRIDKSTAITEAKVKELEELVSRVHVTRIQTAEMRLVKVLGLEASQTEVIGDIRNSYNERLADIRKRLQQRHTDHGGGAPNSALVDLQEEYDNLREETRSQLTALASDPDKVPAAMNYFSAARIMPPKGVPVTKWASRRSR